MALAGQMFSAMPSRIHRQLQRSAAGSCPAAPPVLHWRGGFAGDSNGRRPVLLYSASRATPARRIRRRFQGFSDVGAFSC